MQSITHIVTGASGYSGKYITKRLLDTGAQVRSLTGHPGRFDQFDGNVLSYPYSFDSPEQLTRNLEGVDTLFNTYWIRFGWGELTHDKASENLHILFDSAKAAGVRRIVHVSITNAELNSTLPYFRGKAIVEEALKQSGLSYAILRPTVIFGDEDILVNNIAWFLRRFPVYPIFGSGKYRVQPIFVEDFADLAVELGARDDNVEIDAVGPDIFTYEDMVRLIGSKIGSSTWLVHASSALAMFFSKVAGLILRDVVLTGDEIEALMKNLLVSKSQDIPPGTTRLTDWLDKSAANLGVSYTSELKRHYR
jgi:uncharacterized protein YbjT (DUF2867 family)